MSPGLKIVIAVITAVLLFGAVMPKTVKAAMAELRRRLRIVVPALFGRLRLHPSIDGVVQVKPPDRPRRKTTKPDLETQVKLYLHNEDLINKYDALVPIFSFGIFVYAVQNYYDLDKDHFWQAPTLALLSVGSYVLYLFLVIRVRYAWFNLRDDLSGRGVDIQGHANWRGDLDTKPTLLWTISRIHHARVAGLIVLSALRAVYCGQFHNSWIDARVNRASPANSVVQSEVQQPLPIKR